jgi:hypothetical protein
MGGATGVTLDITSDDKGVYTARCVSIPAIPPSTGASLKEATDKVKAAVERHVKRGFRN